MYKALVNRNKIGVVLSWMLFFFIVAGNVCFSQAHKRNQKLFEKAEQAYRTGQVSQAIQFAEELIFQDSSFTNAYLFLADIYAKIDSTLLEIKYLYSASGHEARNRALINYRLGEAYFSIGDYAKAQMAYDECINKPEASLNLKLAATKKFEQCNFAINEEKNPKATDVTALNSDINTPYNEYWPSRTVDGKQLVFTRLVPDSLRGNRMQEDFYIADFSKGQWGSVRPIVEINTPENEGAQSLSADGKLLFFSACNRQDGYGSCDIYVSVMKEGKWQMPENAGYKLNSRKWEAQPSLSPNSDYLYFSSNREGGFGNKDIWRIKINGFNPDGLPVWGQVENLGDSINTSGVESSPFIHFNNKTLYFSSDGWLGMGKSDIFYSTLKQNNIWSKPVNIGYPINTQNNENGFVVDAGGTIAFFSSERDKNKGIDLYSARLTGKSKTTPVTYVKGKIIDSESKQALVGNIEITNFMDPKNGSFSRESRTNGEFLVCLPLGENYAFNITKKGYLFYSQSIHLDSLYSSVQPMNLMIELVPVKTGNQLVMRNLYFETDSFRLLKESFPELKKLYDLLVQNPTIIVEIGGHTDNIGSEGYNKLLSEKRAIEVKTYLTDKGINAKRIETKGYGISMPVDTNDTPEGRALNRRTEITIL